MTEAPQTRIDPNTREKLRKDGAQWRIFSTFRTRRAQKREATFFVNAESCLQAAQKAHAMLTEEAEESQWESWSIDGMKAEQSPRPQVKAAGQAQG